MPAAPLRCWTSARRGGPGPRRRARSRGRRPRGASTSRSRYRPGTTYIGQDIGAVLAGGTGVCQDFVHVGLAMFRAVGVPARYVSGYFYAVDGTEGRCPSDAEVSVQTHAWVEVAIPGWGWWAIDPTNHLTAGERHVKIGHGRDYDDVLPLRGVYHGTSDQHLFVEVGMSQRRAARPAPPPATLEQAQQQQQQ